MPMTPVETDITARFLEPHSPLTALEIPMVPITSQPASKITSGFRIYNRVLSAAEVQDLYKEYNPYLGIPLDVNITYSGGNVTVSWQGVSGASSYRVYSSTLPNTGFEPDESGSFNATSWTAPATLPRRFYLVRAVGD